MGKPIVYTPVKKYVTVFKRHRREILKHLILVTTVIESDEKLRARSHSTKEDTHLENRVFISKVNGNSHLIQGLPSPPHYSICVISIRQIINSRIFNGVFLFIGCSSEVI